MVVVKETEPRTKPSGTFLTQKSTVRFVFTAVFALVFLEFCFSLQRPCRWNQARRTAARAQVHPPGARSGLIRSIWTGKTPRRRRRPVAVLRCCQSTLISTGFYMIRRRTTDSRALPILRRGVSRARRGRQAGPGRLPAPTPAEVRGSSPRRGKVPLGGRVLARVGGARRAPEQGCGRHLRRGEQRERFCHDRAHLRARDDDDAGRGSTGRREG